MLQTECLTTSFVRYFLTFEPKEITILSLENVYMHFCSMPLSRRDDMQLGIRKIVLVRLHEPLLLFRFKVNYYRLKPVALGSWWA